MRVKGEGAIPCRLFMCGEGPGYHESQVGRPFVGKTGQELDRLLDQFQLPSRKDCYLTNLYREYHGKDYEYTSTDLAQDEPELIEELGRVQPHIIVTLGRHSTRWFLGDVDLEGVQGIAWRLPPRPKLPMLDNRTVVFPIVHPAAGFHNPDMAAYVVSGFTQLAEFLKGNLQPRILFDDPYPEPHYEEIITEAQLQQVLQGQSSLLAIDTEGWPARPWSLQFSGEAGRSYCLRATRPDLLRAFGDYLRRLRPKIVYHHGLHDLGMMRVMGLPTDLPFDDTMVMAYLLQIEPKGLKPLCLHHCNMQMQSYEEVLGDASQRLALDYLVGLWDCEQVDYEQRCQEAFWQEIDKGRRISKFPKLPKTVLQKAAERGLRSKNARQLWDNQVTDTQAAGHRLLGPIPEPTLDHVPASIAIHYGCRDADGTERLLPELSTRIAAMGLREVYDLELGTYPLIDRMQHIGIKPDLAHFAALSVRLAAELASLQRTLVEQTANATFNANSGDHVAAYLFDELGLEGRKLTPSRDRYSTNDRILEGLEHAYPEFPVVGDIRAYRELFKLKYTFVDRLPDFVHRWPHDGRVHATFRTTRTVTGRLAASDPNLLAQPEHGKFAQDFQRGWVAEEGHVLGSWDQSQIELRGLAHLSQDPVLLSAYRRNIDLHASLAERIFGVKPKDQDKSKHRLPAKAINFGIPMGMTYRGLTIELRKNGVMVDEDDAQRWLDETMTLYAGVPVYQQRMIAEAQRQGFIRCLSGRIRYIGGIRSRDDRIREEAERFAFSTPIQESAQWIMKQAEIQVWNDIILPLQREGHWIEPLVQIHDSLKLEMARGLQERVHRMMMRAMTQVPKGFCVPLAVEGEWGPNFGDMIKFPDLIMCVGENRLV